MTDASSRRIHGVDFSGAQDAGENIWISSGEIDGGRLEIEKCRSAADEFDTKDRKTVFKELREFVADRNQSVFGFDFSFGIPKELVGTEDWKEFVQLFSDHQDPETMQETYSEEARKRTNGERAHLKRATDEETDASSPYGFITRNQIFHGIKDVLAPLVHDDSISVLPMQSAEPDRPWALEVYPAATLDQFGLCRNGYKENTEPSRKRRERNFDGLRECIDGELGNDEIRATVIENSDGDALDSLVAAFATFRAVRNDPFAVENERSRIEGHIYV